jgi:glycosyltransferase involved in cell wall biosynthesis
VAYLRSALTASLDRADHVIAVSESTRRDLIQLAEVGPQRVSAVYNGVDPAFGQLEPQLVDRFRSEVFEGRPYILHVGTLEPRKNIDVLMRAFAALRRERSIPHVLALVGARGWSYRPLFELRTELGLERDVEFVDYVRPAALPLWYNGADLFAYPSAYEGFGLPVLEAMACGVPTVTSASSSLSELAGEACITVTPGNQEELAAAMARALTDEALRGELARAGLARASTFSWNTTARRTVKIYRSVAGQRR